MRIGHSNAWPQAITAGADRIFDLPVSFVTSWARLLLACIAFAALAADRYVQAWNSGLVLVLLGYIAFAAVIVLTRSSQAMTRSGSCGVHAVDVTVSSALMVLSEGVASPFYVFYLFTLIAATLRWDWAGALATSAVLTLTLWLVHLTGLSPDRAALSAGADDFSRSAIRGAFLMIGGVMLAYLGAYRERSGQRFARLAAWPQIQADATRVDFLGKMLAHAADVMRAPRVLIIWDEADEPYRHLALLDAGQVCYSREEASLFGKLVSPSHTDRSFAIVDSKQFDKGGRDVETLIDGELAGTFSVRAAATAPFRYSMCQGRVFVLDFLASREEDVSLVSVLSSRLGISLEDFILRERLQAAAAAQERARLGRDLHDGVLQGLAAASIQLKIASLTAPKQTQQQIRIVRDVLADEAQRIRSYVEATRATAPAPGGLVTIEPELRKRVARLQDLWGSRIELTIDPSDLKASLTTARNLGHMITESVSNAVRHGRATRINITIKRIESSISLRVADNGNGIENLAGAYHASDNGLDGRTPLSLKSRAEEIGAVLYLTSSSNGTSITVEIPA